ncbi:riboflavin biosynthesis protein RibF [Bacillus sp. FSL W7-1360]
MKLVYLDVHTATQKADFPACVLALGYFDGIHRGHRTVIETAMNEAQQREVQTAVMTFYPHPKEVLGRPESPMRYLTPLEAKVTQFERLGVDVVYAVHFTRALSQLSCQQFVDQFIVELNASHVVAGFDFTYGAKGQGTMQHMPAYAQGRFTQTTVEKVSDVGEKISSTRIREALDQGDVATAATLLGTPYEVAGTVIHGDARGRQIGFPTANVLLKQRYHLPKNGVYVVQLDVKGATHQGMANIGVRPTFKADEAEPTLEVHLFDFTSDIYDEQVTVRFYERIRSERVFNGVDELKAQLAQDEVEARAYFKSRSDNMKNTF